MRKELTQTFKHCEVKDCDVWVDKRQDKNDEWNRKQIKRQLWEKHTYTEIGLIEDWICCHG